MACNDRRFTERVFSDGGCNKAFCRCCGRRIRIPDEFWVTRDTNDLDGLCRRCELGHPAPTAVEHPRLFA